VGSSSKQHRIIIISRDIIAITVKAELPIAALDPADAVEFGLVFTTQVVKGDDDSAARGGM
jgi:hypothetical protein